MVVMVAMPARDPLMHMVAAQKPSRVQGEMHPGVLSTTRMYGSVPNFASGAYAVLVVSHVTNVYYTKDNGDGGDPSSGEV